MARDKMKRFNINSFFVQDGIDVPDTDIGNYTSIADNCFFHKDDNHAVAANPKMVSTSDLMGHDARGGVKIGNDVWIGRGVSVLSGVTIGDGAIVAAHSVVSKNVPDFALVAGNPARIKRYRFSKEQREALKRIAWWKWDKETFEQRKRDLEDVDTFIKKYDV